MQKIESTRIRIYNIGRNDADSFKTYACGMIPLFGIQKSGVDFEKFS